MKVLVLNPPFYHVGLYLVNKKKKTLEEHFPRYIMSSRSFQMLKETTCRRILHIVLPFLIGPKFPSRMSKEKKQGSVHEIKSIYIYMNFTHAWCEKKAWKLFYIDYSPKRRLQAR